MEISSSIRANIARFRNEGYSYQEDYAYIALKNTTLELIKKHLNARSVYENPTDHCFRVCDVGVGNGLLARSYRSYLESLPIPYEITGVDIIQELVQNLLDEGVIDVGYCNAAEDLTDLKTCTYNMVIMSEVLEHTRTPIIALKEIIRILKPGGVFVGSVPNINQIPDLIMVLFGGVPNQIERKVFDNTFTHESHFTPKLLTRALSAAGFNNIKLSTNLIHLTPRTVRRKIMLTNKIAKKYLTRFGHRIIWTAVKPYVIDDAVLVYNKIKYLILVAGSPRTGKSTLCSVLTKRLRTTYISLSQIRYALADKSPTFTREELALTYQEAVRQILEAANRNENIVIDGCFTDPKTSRKHLAKILSSLPSGYVFLPVVLTANPKTVFNRVRKTYEESVDRDVTPERGMSLAGAYPPFPGAKVFDTDWLSPEVIAEEIINSVNL